MNRKEYMKKWRKENPEKIKVYLEKTKKHRKEYFRKYGAIKRHNGKLFRFTCSNRNCKCLKQGIGLYFQTFDIREAEEHSRKNNSPMWVEEVKVNNLII